jgi:NitT/TauT family transport system substrate-binding protein
MSVEQPRAAIAAVLIVLLVSASAAQTPSTQRAAPQVVRVRTLPHLSYSILHVADAEGYFAREGLKVEFVEMDISVSDVPPLMRGDLDVLPTIISPALLNAVARGGRVRLVAGQQQVGAGECPYMGVLVSPALAKSGILSTPSALKGRRIALNRAFNTLYLLEGLLGTVGLRRADFEAVDVLDAIRGEALQSGRIDLTVLTEPWLTRALMAGQGVFWKGFDEVAPGFPYTVIAYGPTLLDARPEVGRRFMTAYLRAVRQMSLGKTARNLDILEAATRLDRDLLERACWPSVRGNGTVDGASVAAFQAWAIEQGLVDRSLPPSQLIDDRFVVYASGILSKENAK